MEDKGNELDGTGSQRRDQPGEIDFSIESRVGGKTAGGSGIDIGDKVEAEEATLIEEKLGQAIGGDPGEASEDDGKDHHRDERLDDVPGRAEHGLTVFGEKIPPHHEVKQVAVGPQLRHPRFPPRTVGLNDYFAGEMHFLKS